MWQTEKEINAFIPEEYWTLDVILKIKGKAPSYSKVLRNRSEKMTIRSEQELNEIVKKIEMQNSKFQI
ncbi:MAG: hypothetical protein ACLS8T_25855 [Anaerobutyricum sp.]